MGLLGSRQPSAPVPTESRSARTLAPWVREGDQDGSGFGTVLGGGGDVNGDGLGDLLVGEPGYVMAPLGAVGRVLVFLGGTNGFRAEPDITLRGTQVGARFGFHAAILGDLDGDGCDEVGIGTPSFQGGILEQGRVDVYRGARHGVEPQPHWSRVGGAQDHQLRRISRAGDVNGDGFGDVLTGASDGEGIPSGEGEALLFLGSRTGLTSTVAWRRKGEQKTELFGDVVAALGDVNRDGRGDVLFGTALYDHDVENEGRVEMFLGTTTGLEVQSAWVNGPTAHWLHAESAHREAQLGGAIAWAGDLNGDGLSEIAVGAPHWAYEDDKEGHVFVWFGRPTGFGDVPDWWAEGNEFGGHFGTGVAGVGDVNGDGYADLVVTGRTLDHGETNEGVVALYLGTRHGLSRWPDWTAESNERGAELGGVVAALGDANGDGLDDFAVGSRYHSRNEAGVGEVRVFWGRRGPWNDGSGWSPKLAWIERVRRFLDRAMAQAGWWLALGVVGIVVAAVLLLVRLALARRRAQREVETIRSRLHDFVGAELAGRSPPDRRLRGMMEELRATIWTLKQDAPTVAGLVGYLSDWAWRFAREHGVTLRLDLPHSVVGPRTIDFEIAECLQTIVRRALSDAVESGLARSIVLRIEVERRSILVEVRDDGSGERPPDDGAWHECVRNWGGSLEREVMAASGVTIRVRCPFRVKAWRLWGT